jgi:hypothetical protein
MRKSPVDIVRDQERAKTYRANFERQWTDIARYVFPRADDFNNKSSPGTRKEQYVFDSTAQLALLAFSAAMESMLTPRTQKWHHIRPVDPSLAADEDVMLYCERLRDLLFRIRYSATSNFAAQASEHYMGLGSFGTSIMFVEDGLGGGIRYQSIPLSECYVQENAWGVIDTIYRRYTLTARQAYQKWGDRLPNTITDTKDAQPDREFEFLHAVMPNDDREPNDRSWKGMAYYACDICISGNVLLNEGGYRTWPYPTSRYVTAPREVYGRSPAWDSLADIKTLNEMSKTGLRYGQLVTDPPWITADVDAMAPFTVRPGSVNAGYMNERGDMLAKSLAPQGDPRFSLEMMDQRRGAVNRSFLVTLFQILVETPEMTATEAMLRAQEKGALLAPTMGRQQGEFLGPLIAREIDILDNSGRLEQALGPMPDALRDAGGLVDIEYDSPLSRLQRAEEGIGILRTLEALTPLAQIDSGVLRVVNAERTFRRLRDINGAPLDMLNTSEELAAIKEAEAAQAQAAALLEAAPVAAQTAKTMAEAGAVAGQARF